MKFNWGTGIVFAFIGFIGFIMYFIVTMSVDDRYKHDLVTEDYYAEELVYQKTIDKLKNSKTLLENIKFKRRKEGLIISFPNGIDYTKITGHVILYRPSNKELDFETPLSLSSPYLLIPDQRLIGGLWNLYIDWKYEGVSYLFKETILY